MKKLLLILLCLPMIGFGQSWEKHYNLSIYDSGESIQQTSDGGYILTGHISVLEQDIILIKLNSLGDTLWTNKLIATHDQWGNSVKQSNDNGYIICGVKEDAQGNGDIWIIKTDSSGNPQWDLTFGDTLSYDIGGDIRQTNDGGYIITGEFNDSLCLIKINSFGIEQWRETYDYGRGKSVEQTSDGGYIICGDNGENNLINGWGWGYDLPWIIKTNSNGIIVWDSVLQVGGDDDLYSIKQTNDGNYVSTGRFNDTIINSFDLWFLKIDSLGSIMHDKTLSSSFWLEGKDIQKTNDNGYIICGLYGDSDDIYSKVWLLKTDSIGDTLWTKKFGDPWNELNEGRSVQQTVDGGYIICGWTQYNNMGPSFGDFYIIKTDGNGNITSTFNIPIPNANRKLEKVVDILGRETKGKTNEPLFYIYDDGSVEKRITIE